MEKLINIDVIDRKKERISKQVTLLPYFPKELLSIYSPSKQVGKGGFARVFRALKTNDRKLVAVKVPVDLDPKVGKSFLSEIENWNKLEHDNIIRLLDFNILPAVFLEMEFADQSLEEVTKPFIVERATHIILEVLRGLAYAHSKGMIHRDLKPSNILFINSVPKISDWGLSKLRNESRLSSSLHSFTPTYAAPEQYSPQTFGTTDERTDIFQIGIIFYELVTAERPFKGDDITQVLYAIAKEYPKPPSIVNPEALDVEPIILKCLQKKKEDRYQSVTQLQNDLAGFLGIDFKKSLALSKGSLEKVMLCCDLIEVYSAQENYERCLTYMRNLLGFVKGTELREMIQNELSTLEFYSQQAVRITERIPKIKDIIHRSRMGE